MAPVHDIKLATLPEVVLSVNTLKNVIKLIRILNINTIQAIIIILLHLPQYYY